MGSPNKKSSDILPGISKKLAYRTLGFVVVVGGLIYGMEWFLGVQKDLGQLAKSDTVGWIAAVQYLPGGQQAVLISPDGKVHTEAGYKPNTVDRDLAWSPKGNFLFFVSDREDRNFNVYRWAAGKPDAAERRTIGTRARSNPKFAVQGIEDNDGAAKPLITSGGVVQEFDPIKMSTQQILPPTTKEIAQSKGGGDENGTEGQFEGAYGDLGTSFRLAEWCGDRKYIAAIMRRDRGEILVVQGMDLVEGKLPGPMSVMAGDHIEMDVNPKDGSVVFTVQGFQWPQAPPLDASGKPRVKPFVNAVGVYEPVSKKLQMVVHDEKEGFGSPAVKPDGQEIAVVLGKVENGGISSEGLVTLPFTNKPGYKPLRIPGDVHEPSWSPDGTHLVFARRESGGKRAIYDCQVLDGTPPRNITGEIGDFGNPIFSPQKSGGG